MTFNPTPMTEGLHQRCDDSYFSVGCSAAGWYWVDTDADGEFDDTAAVGYYGTVELAAAAGHADDRD